MANLTKTKWPLGWTPSANDNGDPSGLLKMTNLKLDDLGALTLQRGMTNVGGPFGGYVHSVYSRFINNVKSRFVGLSTGEVYESSNNFVNSGVLLSSGSNVRARFASLLGSVFISSGTQRAKFDGLANWHWGLPTPIQPVTAVAVNQQIYDVSGLDGTGTFSQWQALLGSPFENDVFCKITTDPVTNFASVGTIYSSVMDFTAFPGGGIATPTDTFSMQVGIGDTTVLQAVRIQFILHGDFANKKITDYFWYEWDANINQSPFTLGIGAASTLTALRSDFTRVSSPGNHSKVLGWNDVIGVTVTFVCSGLSQFNQIGNLQWAGSSQGPLTGDIDYVQQNVADNGHYVAKSACGALMSQSISLANGAAQVTPIINSDPQMLLNGGQIWIYRRGGLLPTFLRVAVLDIRSGTYTDSAGNVTAWSPASPTFTDICPDSAAQAVDLPANLSLTSVRDIPDEILSIVEGAYFGKCIFITFTAIYISDELNPDAIDNRFTIRVSGDPTEYNLWIEKLASTVLMVGTGKNLYELSGTLEVFADGTMDVTVRPMGEAHPPIAYEKALDAGNIYYMASDGWRMTNGGASQLMSPQLNLLMRGNTRYGQSPVNIQPNALVIFPCTVYKGQLVTGNPCQDGSRPLFIYDILLQYWRQWQIDPVALFTEEDGTLIAGFGDPGDYYVRQLDVGSTINNVGAQTLGQAIDFLTVYDSNQSPNNRKDAYVLRLQMNTGGQPVTVQISDNNRGVLNLGTFSTNWSLNDSTEIYIDLFSPLTQVFGAMQRYQIRIFGANLTTFVLNRLSLEYEEYPEQTSQLRLRQTNLGSYARKRVTNFAFVIDTLGLPTTFTPIVDGVTLSALTDTFTFNGKSTYVLYFNSEVIGTDFGGIITSLGTSGAPYPPFGPLPGGGNTGVFEFYELALSEIVSEKLPVPVKYLVIPANDYGKPNRKRHSSYKFQILTRGHDVQFTPILDGIALAPKTFNTVIKQTVEYFFPTDTIAIDVGGTLASLANTPFEFYGVIVPQEIEVLPPRLTEFRIPESNYGIAAKKRTRTMPMQINTNGHDVTFTPIVDQVRGTPTVFNTPSRQTVFHYFSTDIFGVDYSGELTGSFPFEFYGLEKPEEVEILPVSKVFDQVGPIHLARIGKVVGFRLRIITGEPLLPYVLYGEDSIIAKGTLTTVPGIDTVYEIEWITKGRNAVVSRIEIGPSPNKVPFNRYYLDLKVNIGGTDSQIKMQRIGGDPRGPA